MFPLQRIRSISNAYYNHALATAKSGDSDKALEHAFGVVMIDKDFPEAKILLGKLLWKNGLRDLPLEYWRQALRLAPDNHQIFRLIKTAQIQQRFNTLAVFAGFLFCCLAIIGLLFSNVIFESTPLRVLSSCGILLLSFFLARLKSFDFYNFYGFLKNISVNLKRYLLKIPRRANRKNKTGDATSKDQPHEKAPLFFRNAKPGPGPGKDTDRRYRGKTPSSDKTDGSLDATDQKAGDTLAETDDAGKNGEKENSTENPSSDPLDLNKVMAIQTGKDAFLGDYKKAKDIRDEDSEKQPSEKKPEE